MRILAFDTSGQTAAVAVLEEHTLRGEVSTAAQAVSGGKHSKLLMPMADALLKFCGLTLQEMDSIACVCGPGSFTGLRIGAATAIGLASAVCKPLVPVPTLDALACNMAGAAGRGGYVMPMMDARRGQVYTAVYRFEDDGGEAWPVRVGRYTAIAAGKAPELLTDSLGEACVASTGTAGQGSTGAALDVGMGNTGQGLTSATLDTHVFKDIHIALLGDGADAYREQIAAAFGTARMEHGFAPAHIGRQRAASAAACAIRMAGRGLEHFTVDKFRLLYIRRPQAERVRLGEDG